MVVLTNTEQQGASEFGNVELHTAFMPEMFGTHHSKMMILFRHDDTAQVIIHTANMIAKDWTNMTNAVWVSPPLPKTPESAGSYIPSSPEQYPIGSGERFKVDLLNYLRFYDRRKATCRPLSNQLSKYDFSAVRGALVASVPGIHDAHDVTETNWAWAGLKRTLRAVPCNDGDSTIAVQISSIATLGAKDDWLQKTMFDALSRSTNPNLKTPRFKVVFPTSDEIRQSLDGYVAGGSIHTKIQSQQQAKQLQYLRPILHHWANDSSEGRSKSHTAGSGPKILFPILIRKAELPEDARLRDGGRARAAPHIKTYIRYNDTGSVDWALLTSANLSKQAWGEALRSTGEIRVASWEIGVLVWPELLEQGSVMVPSFKTDMPSRDEWKSESGSETEGGPVVGLRVPYNWPLQRYGSDEIPWVASMAHAEPDRHGQVWGV